MAKKSIRYSADDKLIAQNWTLIQKSGEKSDDAIAIKEFEIVPSPIKPELSSRIKFEN